MSSSDLTVDAASFEPFTLNGETFHPVLAQRKYPLGSCTGCALLYRKSFPNAKYNYAYYQACTAVAAMIAREHPRLNCWSEHGPAITGTAPRNVCGDIIWVVNLDAYLKARLAGEEYRER